MADLSRSTIPVETGYLPLILQCLCTAVAAEDVLGLNDIDRAAVEKLVSRICNGDEAAQWFVDHVRERIATAVEQRAAGDA